MTKRVEEGKLIDVGDSHSEGGGAPRVSPALLEALQTPLTPTPSNPYALLPRGLFQMPQTHDPFASLFEVGRAWKVPSTTDLRQELQAMEKIIDDVVDQGKETPDAQFDPEEFRADMLEMLRDVERHDLSQPQLEERAEKLRDCIRAEIRKIKDCQSLNGKARALTVGCFNIQRLQKMLDTKYAATLAVSSDSSIESGSSGRVEGDFLL